MHVASGLFAQGHYAESEFFNGTDAKFWMIQAGITKNWFGLGNTSFYGEYGEAQDFIKGGVASGASNLSVCSLLPPPMSTSSASASSSRSTRRPWKYSSAGGGLRSMSRVWPVVADHTVRQRYAAISTSSTAVPASGSDPDWPNARTLEEPPHRAALSFLGSSCRHCVTVTCRIVALPQHGDTGTLENAKLSTSCKGLWKQTCFPVYRSSNRRPCKRARIGSPACGFSGL